MPPLRIAVIGAGAEPWLAGTASTSLPSPACRTTISSRRCVTAARRSADRRAATYGAQVHYSDVRDLFAAEKPDVVLSLAPKDSHVVIAMTAARCGIHVLTEIPVAHTRRYAAAIAQACRDNGVLWEVAEQVWVWPQEQLKQRLLAAGHLGHSDARAAVVSDGAISRLQRCAPVNWLRGDARAGPQQDRSDCAVHGIWG